MIVGALLFSMVSTATSAGLPGHTSFAARPRLVLTLVIDQFRADTLPRFKDRLLPARQTNGRPGGLRYLMENGTYYPYAQYEILQSMTGPGHATILTGSYPSQNGIAANDWYDDIKRERTYCTEDAAYSTIGAEKQKPHAGTSPRNLVGTTVGDELKNSGFSQSKVITVALKDRAAILLGGHRADGAYWMDKSGKRWVSSTFYFPDGILPAWVGNVNTEISKAAGSAFTWKAEGPGTGLSLTDSMALKDEWNQRIGSKFPHKLKSATPEALSSPWGIDATLELALAALRTEKLGSDRSPDLLAVSFSTHDYIAHAFGPNSREAEEITLAEDRAIARLLGTIEQLVPGGLAEVTVTLTADHGGPHNPDWLAKNRVNAGRIDEAALLTRLEERLQKEFGKPQGAEKWIGYGVDFAWTLDPHPVVQSGKPNRAFEEVLRAELLKEPGAAHVLTASDVNDNRFPAGALERQIKKTWFKGRAPSVMLIPKPFYQPAEDTVTHLTGYSYDAVVPLILSGKGIQKGVQAVTAHVVDLAPTLTWLLGVTPPALSEGRVLSEAVR
jgi:hypothetical protein